MALRDCTGFVGRRLLIEDTPSRRLVRNAIFIPPGNGPFWGLFEPSGRAVAEALVYSGDGSGNLHVALGSTNCPDLPENCPTLSAEYDYLFMGHVFPHFKHLLTGLLGRLWALPAFARSRLKIVYSCDVEISALMAHDHFRSITAALGLGVENFLRIETPVRFQAIDVPALAMEELSLIHRVFAELAHSIGRQIVQTVPSSLPARAIYLSMERQSAGNVRVENEAALTQALRQYGVGIAFPETMSFREQLSLWASNPSIIGFSGAALHMSVFFPKRRVFSIAHGPDIWTNQCLIDMANGNDARYLYEDTGLEPIGPGSGFNMNYRIRDPERMAAEIAEIALV